MNYRDQLDEFQKAIDIANAKGGSILINQEGQVIVQVFPGYDFQRIHETIESVRVGSSTSTKGLLTAKQGTLLKNGNRIR